MVFGHYNADICTYYNVAVIEFAHGLGSQLKNIETLDKFKQGLFKWGCTNYMCEKCLAYVFHDKDWKCLVT